MTVLENLRLGWRARWPILIVVVTAAALAAVVVFFQPKVYSARATILAPKETQRQSLSASLGALLGMGGGGNRDGGGVGLPSMLGMGPMISTNQDMFVAILKSRTLRQEVTGALAKTYGAGVGVSIVSLDVGDREKGIISLTLEATDPRVAADAANLYFELLERTIDRLSEQATELSGEPLPHSNTSAATACDRAED